MKYLSELTNKAYTTQEELEADEEKFLALKKEKEELARQRAEKEKKEAEIRQQAEKDIYQTAREIADKRKELDKKLEDYTNKYKVFTVTGELREDKEALDEILVKYRVFPFFHF